ncbi:MAG TPA: type II toxin-antitoxin system RelB/DinJ family antitoxin [Paraburkholderia sp.]|nr:type II toxin-antitoxin system RelB/DinJ family antitoxin [Paraburkholderia sp.]
MTASALVQVRIDPALKERAAAVLDHMGLTVSDAVRILLTRIANEGALPFDFTVDPEVYDAWFRAKVREALEDPRPAIAADEVEARFAARRAAARRAAGGSDGGTGGTGGTGGGTKA